MRRIGTFSWALWALLSIFCPAAAFAREIADRDAFSEAQLSADRMRFDSRSGDFLATGRVVIRAGGLTVHASRGTGNIAAKEVHFAEGIAASGDWRGDPVDLTAGSISLYFAQTPTYIADGGVKGSVGDVFVDADKFYMKGPDIAARGVRRLENRALDIAFGAESLYGVISGGVLAALTAEKNVWLRGRPGADGEMADIRGDTAVYSIERGSVVLSGNVRAVQKGRTLTSESIVYFPANNRIEAIGGVVREGASMDARPARITIDLKQEERKAPR